LSDADFEFLNLGQYSQETWEAIGRKHGVDPTTREPLPNTGGRAFVAVVRKYSPVALPGGYVVTTGNINAVPINPRDTAAIRASLNGRDLTKPVNNDTTTEEI
jgi:hypothetical protein